MDFIRGVTCNQVLLFPESVEDYITEANPVRFIDALAADVTTNLRAVSALLDLDSIISV